MTVQTEPLAVGAWRTAPVAELVVYDFGAVSVGFSIPLAGPLDELPALNTEFHAALAAAADNELLAGTLGRLSDIIRWVYAARISQRSERSWAEHAAIVAAVAAQDPELAHRCGTDHIARASAAYADSAT